MADEQRASDGKGDNIKHQLEALETQQKQLIALLGDDTESPLMQLQSELAAAIDALRQKLEAASAPSTPPSRFGVGNTCLAPRVFDRRRARAVIEAIDLCNDTCTVSWTNPRQKGELSCRFWKEGGCKFFGQDCPYSHGVQVSLGDLRPDSHPWLSQRYQRAPQSEGEGQEVDRAGEWLATLGAGSQVLARYVDRVWYEAVAEGPATDGSLIVRFDGFEEDGPVPVPASVSHLAPLESAGLRTDRPDLKGADRNGPTPSARDSGDDDADIGDAWATAPSKESELSDDEEVFFTERVLGERETSVKAPEHHGAGSPSDVYVFGEWERYTKGFGSRMMSRMGYRRGEGLGKGKQGISRPVSIHVLPERRALDHLREDDGDAQARATAGGRSMKGGIRKPQNRARAEEEPQKTMFDFINATIHSGKTSSSGASRKVGSDVTTPGGERSKTLLANQRPAFDRTALSAAPSDRPWKTTAQAKVKKATEMTKLELRAHLLEAREAESALAAKIARLEQTVARNAERDPRIAFEASQKLDEVRCQAREVRASRDRAERALGDKADKGKRGGKGGLFAF